MNDYMQLLARNGIRFTGSPVIVSPQLEDLNGYQGYGTVITGKEGDPFRVVLYVPSLELHEVKISFPGEADIKVHMEHGRKPMGRRNRDVNWSRDCEYMFKLPDGLSKEALTVQWTEDDFLVIQSRNLESQAPKDSADRLIPLRTVKILKPYVDIGLVSGSAKELLKEVKCVANYTNNSNLYAKGDVLQMLKGYPYPQQSKENFPLPEQLTENVPKEQSTENVPLPEQPTENVPKEESSETQSTTTSETITD